MKLLQDIFDPDAKPSLTSIINVTSVVSGLVIGFIGAFIGNELVVDYCRFLVGGGMTAKILQFGVTVTKKGRKDE